MREEASAGYAVRAGIADRVPDASIGAIHLAPGAVGTGSIADGAVTSEKIADGPGSGLDSDKLDGKDSDEFASAAGLAELQNALAALQAKVISLESRNQMLEDKLQFLTVAGQNMVIEGANLYVRSGSGATDGPVNGLGNLVIGYDETRGESFCSIGTNYQDQATCEQNSGIWLTDNKGGSHNLVSRPWY